MIGKAITTVLMNDSAITTIISNRLYPVSDVGENFPSVYYMVRAMPEYNKNGVGSQMVAWEITLLTMAKTYDKAWDLSLKCKQALEKKGRSKVGDIKFTKLECTDISDDYEFNINSYGQTITFQCRTQNVKAT